MKNTKPRTYTVVRTVKEIYTVQALTRRAAIEAADAALAPDSVVVQSVYANWDRPVTLPKGYVGIELNFQKPS